MTVKKLIIGCGYLGARVARRWRDDGHQVFVTTRHAATADRFAAEGLTPIRLDVLDRDSLSALPEVDAVVFAVALDRASGASMRDVYVNGLAYVLDALPPPRAFIYVSSSSVYGQTDGGWVDETARTVPEEPSGKIVLQAERELQSKLPAAMILRFSGIYGPNRLLRRASIIAGAPIVGDAEKWLNLIHVDDGATAVLNAAVRGEAGRIYNICDDKPTRRHAFYTEMARLLGGAVATIFSPACRPTVAAARTG